MMERERMRMGISSDPSRPEYPALLINGRAPADPPLLEVNRGERLRLRLLNLASATTFRVTLAGHRLTVTHADGRPVEPVTVDAVVLGMGERYDVLVEADRPGAWTLGAASVLGTPEPARAVLRYRATRATRPEPVPEPGARRVLTYADLRSVETALEPAAGLDRTYRLNLTWGMMMAPHDWSIDGERYPDATPLPVAARERVRVRLRNHSMIHHPMHLHGHFFRVGSALRDTALVPAHMGVLELDFVTDNPGDWFFHCHNLYHMEAGMARVFRYV
jgi:FtsP/CotA-like multicopper oxidase with cupredoxin domain